MLGWYLIALSEKPLLFSTCSCLKFETHVFFLKHAILRANSLFHTHILGLSGLREIKVKNGLGFRRDKINKLRSRRD